MNADSTARTDVAPHAGFEPNWVDLGRFSAAAVVSLLALVAGVLAWRRLDGALLSPLQPAALTAVGATVALAVVFARLTLRASAKESAGATSDRLLEGAASACVVIIGASLSLPESAALGLAGLWVMLVGEEVWGWAPTVTRAIRRRTRGATQS